MSSAVETRTDFFFDDEFARAVGEFYGTYKTTFESDHHQVRAHLFERDGFLIAHVSFKEGYDGGRATDPYVSRLSAYARQNGYGGKLQLILS